MSLSFLDSLPDEESLPPWKVLIVDDEEDIHAVTKMALKRFELDGRQLSYLHAYSGEEAKAILAQEKDIALVFLDVVMETDDAGLKVAEWMRNTLNNHLTRIVLRTGQPGQAPEESVIVDYDINDYKQKTELSRTKLFTTVFSALRAYRDIVTVDEARRFEELYRNGLERVINSTSEVLEQKTLKEFFNGLLMQVMSLLRIGDESMLLQIRGVGAVLEHDDYEILARIGEDTDSSAIDDDMLKVINKAREKNRSIVDGNILVGFFPSQSGKASLLCLKGIDAGIDDIDLKLLEVFSGNVSLAFDNLLLNREIIETQEELIYRLGDVVESRSNEAGNHVRRMSEVCHLLAKEVGLNDEDAELIKQAAPMHDIGKIATPDAVLLKPGKLDHEEMDVMKEHPQVGYDILKGSQRPILQSAAIISQQHHEKYDGSGYPNGICGENIHIFARIVAVADVFDALTHKRCYKEAWPIDKVISMMNDIKGSHLDPVIVEALLNKMDEALSINKKYQDRNLHY